MPFGTPTAPTTPVTGNGAASITSASYTPSAVSLQFALLSTRKGDTLAAPTVSDSVGLTWVLLTDASVDLGSGARVRQRIYMASVGTSPAAMTVTLTVNDTARATLQLLEMTGYSPTPTNVNFATTTTGSPSVTLPLSPVATSMLLGFFACANSAAAPPTPPSGFTEVEQFYNATGQIQVETCYQSGGGAATNAWSSAAINGAGAVAEFLVVAGIISQPLGARQQHLLVR